MWKYVVGGLDNVRKTFWNYWFNVFAKWGYVKRIVIRWVLCPEVKLHTPHRTQWKMHQYFVSQLMTSMRCTATSRHLQIYWRKCVNECYFSRINWCPANTTSCNYSPLNSNCNNHITGFVDVTHQDRQQSSTKRGLAITQALSWNLVSLICD